MSDSDIIPEPNQSDIDEVAQHLFSDIQLLINSAKQRAANTFNSEFTLLYK